MTDDSPVRLKRGASGESTESTALEGKTMLLQQQQRHYDRLHHEKRLADLASGQFKHFGRHERLILETGSKECLRLINEHGMSTNSVDVRDTEYLADLDTFEITTSATSA